MAKYRESSTDKDMIDIGSEFDGGMDKKPNWINLAQLGGPKDHSFANRLLYKPALRFHGITGGIWGQGLSDAPSMTSDPPPSYRFAESTTSRQPGGDACSTCDVDTLYNTVNISAQSPLTLRRRNTVAVILVAIALLAAVAAVTGVILHFLHPKAMLRANVRFTIANRNYTEDMRNQSSIDFHDIARPLCQEMDVYFLTSELADFYLGCNVVSMRKDTSRAKNGTEVHYTLDFTENKVSNDAERIKKIIMRKSGRHKTEDTLYLTIRDFLVYLRSVRVGVEVLPLPDDHPGRKHRPRIPWNDDIDFISRKSEEANSSSVNQSVLIDIKQLTNNLTETLDRKTVDMFIDIPKQVLPGGEINELPFLAPTPFHPSATLHQHAHALHLSNTAERMPLLSHMLQNISLSSSTNMSNKQSVLHGAGAFINPSRASVYLSENESKHIPTADRLPTVQELNIRNDIIAQKIRSVNNVGNAQDIHRHDNIAGQIEASFHDVYHNFNTNVKATEIVEKGSTSIHSEHVTSDELNQKIFTIFTDVFLIIGSNSGTNEINMAQSTPSYMATSSTEIPNQLNEFVEDKINVEKKPRPSSSAEQESLPDKSFSKHIPPLRMKTKVSVDIQVTEAPQLIANPLPGFDKHNWINTSLNGQMDSSLPQPISIDETMQMNEIVVDLPTQEAAVPIKENIEWINIFNVPQRTLKIHVGNIKNESGLIPVNNKMFQIPIQNNSNTNKAVQVKALDRDTGIQRGSTSVFQNVVPDIVREDLQQNYFDIIANTYPQLQSSKNIRKINKDAEQIQSKVNKNSGQDVNISTFVNRISDGLPIKRNSYYGPFFQNNGMINTFRNTAFSRNKLHNIERNNNIRNNVSNTDMSGFPHPVDQSAGVGITGPTSNEGSSSSDHQTSNFNWQLNSPLQTAKKASKFKSVPTHFNFNTRRRTLIATRPSRINTNSRQNVAVNSRSMQWTMTQQPWIFLNNIGVDLAFFDTSNTGGNRDLRNNGAVLRKSLQPFRNQQKQIIFNRRNGNSQWPGSIDSNPRNAWRERNIIGGQLEPTRSMSIGRNPFYPYFQMGFNWGLPKSPDFSDISDMKEILRELVNNMYNMTTKIDNMQDAINFINKTFHETHQPLFNLEETLGNMTISLGNLNQNLNSINATMNAFKEFLKRFGNTVFNIDDVIKHIDETIGNLGNAVSFIENSMTDLNGTVTGIAEHVVDIDKTLTHVNRSALDLNNTAAYSNQTLDSMKDTLISLENAVSSLALKVHVVTDDADVLDISLKNINDTVKNTHNKLKRLHGKMLNLNSSMLRIETQVEKLNDTYTSINKTLQNMNEPYMFINGTVLEVIQNLSNMDEQLADLHKIMDIVQTNITVMNMSLLEAMDWMDEMVQTLTDFNLWVRSNNNTIKISLRNKGMIETIGMLLNMNGTLSEIGHKVDDINSRLDNVDQKLQYLEDQLSNLDRTLDNIDAKFKLLDKTLQTINVTVTDTNSSLNSINSTVQAMDATFSKIDVSFGNINITLDNVNKTLTMINSTGREINSTINNVTKTFTDLAVTVDETEQAAKNLASKLSKFTGSVPELNLQLYNANESLRITKNKADIARESYRLLNKTLSGVDGTLADIRDKIVDTNSVLQNTNTSLSYVNESLLGIQNSFQSLNAELSEIHNSFTKMKSSMEGFGPAFPNIRNSIEEAQTKMSELQPVITDIDTKLHDHKITRDILVKKHSLLQDSLKSISESIDFIQISNGQLKNQSFNIFNDIVSLNESVHKTTDIYNKTDLNIRYINETHHKIKIKYEKLQNHSVKTNSSLGTVKQNMDLLKNDFEELKNVLTNFSNIDAQIDLMLSSIDNEGLNLKMVNEKFQNGTEQFKSVDEVIWDKKGNPSGVYFDFQALVNNTEFVNQTVDEYEHVLNDTDKDVTDIAKFIDDMLRKKVAIYNMRNKIDMIEENEANLNKEVADTDEQIKDKHSNLTGVLDMLKDKLERLQRLRNTYGNINGTFNSGDSFDVLENDIKSTISAVHDALTSLQNSSGDYRKAVELFKSANDTYQNNVFDLSQDSQKILNNTLLVMEKTKLQISDLGMDLDAIATVLNDIDDKIKEVDNGIDRLENTLIYEKEKNNFVTARRSKMESKFNKSFEMLNETYTVQNALLTALQELKNRSSMIDERTSGIPNINISISQEKNVIEDFFTKVTDFEKEIFTANNYLETFYERFMQYDESNKTLQAVKMEYDKYYHAVEHLGAVVGNISSAQSSMFEKARNISETFDHLTRQLNKFESLQNPILKAGASLESLNSKLNSTTSNANQAVDELTWLKDEFDSIKRNYTNFTATEIDLTESYVIEAFNEIQDHFLNVTTELQLVNVSVMDIQKMFDGTEYTYKEKIFDRKNIEPTIQNIIVPNLQEISEQIEKTNIDLDKINSSIRKLERSLKGINETIHITNKQLFIDRQKELLADTKFPDLELSTETVNESLSASSKRLDETKKQLEKSIDGFKDLKERLENQPSINISLDEFDDRFKSYNNSIENIYKRLSENYNLLNEAKETMWMEDGKRYLNNETVHDIKVRYQNVQSLLDNISTDIKDIDFIIDSVNNGTEEINKELYSLNESLNEFDKSNNSTDQLLQEMALVNSMISAFQEDISHLQDDAFNINLTFGNLKSRYKDINGTVYDEYVTPFEVDLSGTFDNLGLIKADENDAAEKLSLANKFLKLAKELRQKTLLSQLALDSAINNNTVANTNITTLLNDFKLVASDIKRNISDTRKLINDLANRVPEMENVFTRQEKEDYFGKYFPRKTYDNLNDTILATKEMNGKLDANTTNLAHIFNDLKRTLSVYENINFDTSPIEKSVTVTAGIVVNNSKSLRNISDNYSELEHMLYADDGSLISDNETFYEMRRRYEVIDTKMDSISADLENINYDIKNRNREINKNKHKIDALQSLVDSYENVRQSANDLRGNNKKLNMTVDALKHFSSERSSMLRRETVTYDTIISAFNETTSDAIQKLKLKIDDSIKLIEGNLSRLEQFGTHLHQNVSACTELTENYSNGLLAFHTHTEPLSRILLDFPEVNETVSNIAHFTNETIKSVKKDGRNIDHDLGELEDDINRLKHLLIEQEKQDYIRDNTPKLLELVEKVKGEINQTKLEIQDLTDKSHSLDGLYETVKVLTSNETALEISLISSKNVIHSLNETIPRFDDIWNKSYNAISNLDITFLDEPMTYLNENDTIEDIKSTFEKLNRTLQIIGKDMSSVLNEKEELVAEINKENNFLRNLNEEVYDLQEIKFDHVNAKKNISHLGDKLVESKSMSELLSKHIINLEENLADIVRNYGDVKEPSLHHDIGTLTDEIKVLKYKHNIINSLLNTTSDNYNDTSMESKHLDTILSNVSRTLEDLQTKTGKAIPVKSQITIGIITLDENFANITDSMKENMNIVPKMNTSIENLRERFRRRQILEYIKENFPTLLEEYASVNETLNHLDTRIPEVSARLQVLKSNISDLKEALNDIGLDQVPVNDILDTYEYQNETLATAVGQKMSIENMFNEFQDIISNNFDSNDTLDDIKKRFVGYETKLHDMNKNLIVVHETLDGMGLEINKTFNRTKAYNVSLGKYKNILKAVKDQDQALNGFGNLLNNTSNDLEYIENTAELQKNKLDAMGKRFKDINSSVLNAKKKAIEQSLKDFTDDAFKTRDVLQAEMHKYDKLVQNNTNLQVLLSQNFTSFEQLQNITEEATDALKELSLKKQMIQLDTETKIIPNIPTYNVTVASIKKDTDGLHNEFLKKEKDDFILAQLPQLLLQYKNMNESLLRTKQRLPKKDRTNIRLNQTIAKLQHRLDSIENIRISTENEALQQVSLTENITGVGIKLHETSRLFGNLDTSIFERTDWSSFTVGDVEMVFDTFMNNISLINATLENTNKIIDSIDATLNESLHELNHTNSVLNRYDNSVNTSIANENGLQQLSFKLGETHALLDDVKERFYYDGDRLFNLTRQYSEVTNSEIEKVIEETRSVLEGRVGLRIPLANKLFSNRIMENYNVVKDRFDDVVYILNDNYTTKGELENVLGDVEDTLNNVTLETENMVSNEEFYREDAIRLSELLNESNALLNKLEDMFEMQMKNDILHASMPNLTTHWNMQNARLQNITNALNVTSNDISNVNFTVENIDNIINESQTVTIPTGFIHNNLTLAATTLGDINISATNAKLELDNIPVFDIDIDILTKDKNISVDDVQEQLAVLNRSLQASDNYIKAVENRIFDMNDNVSHTTNNAILLNDTVSEFKRLQGKTKELDESINKVGTKFNNTYSALNNANAEITYNKESLEGIRNKYKNYEYDSSDLELLLRVTGDKIAELNNTLSDSGVILAEAGAEFVYTNDTLYTETDDMHVLNESLNTINSKIPVTASKVSDVNKALDTITNTIPDLNIQLQDIKDMLQLMNDTLMNEELKSDFAENALPRLEEKYKITNRTFEMTNKTLQKMADDLEMLNNYIEELKQRMTGISTINMSMSDIDANITHLENRLVIMQDHYNNVKDIVNKFQKDVSVNNIFGRNISLSDVEDQYNSFNETLDLINGVLTEIDSDAYEMEEHFEALNSTMYKIDHALDRFEKKQMNTKTMEIEIETMGKDITDTHNSISDMQNTVKGLSQTFDDLHNSYSDVIHSTAENNTLVTDLLTNMNQSLVDLQSLMVKLDEVHSKNNENFVAMNGTLFKNINTYEDLNNTLDDVKNKLLKLSKSIHKLERDIADVKQRANGENSTLSVLSELLESLNNTLFREQVKYDFIKNNLGNLEQKFASLKAPVEAANLTLSNVTEKLSNVTGFIKDVAEKLKNFSNVHISLENDTIKLNKFEGDLGRIKSRLINAGGKFEELQNNFTQLDNRSGDMNDIVGKYNDINETLDTLQDNLTEMLSALDGINLETDAIFNRTEKIDSSLTKLDVLNTSASSLTDSIAQLEEKLDNTNITLKESESTTNDLKQTLLDMEQLYLSLDNPTLLDRLSDLMKKVNDTSVNVNNAQSSYNGLVKRKSDTAGKLNETQTRLNSKIVQQKMLDDINTASENALKSIQEETDILTTQHNTTENDVIDLQSTIAFLTQEILQLNETLAEEKRKKQFIAENFPEMKERYNLLNSFLDGSDKNITDANERIDNVANSLSNVKERLDNFTEIAIPLDSENNEVVRIRQKVANVAKDFRNVSQIYKGLKIEKLNNLSIGFDNLVDTYTGFDETMQDVEKTINQMNNALDDLNKSVSVLKESVNDINTTVDEYIETGEKINDVLESGNILSAKIGYTNQTIAKLSDEVQSLANSLQELSANYSHIKDPQIIKTQDLINQLLKTSKDNIRTLDDKMNVIGTDNKNSHMLMDRMNETYMSTKQLLGELKQHINDAKNTSGIVNNSLAEIETQRKGINESAGAVKPDLKVVLDKIGQLSDTLVKEQDKLDLIATNKPAIEERFKNLQKPLGDTNKHISLTEVKLADLKYSIKTIGSRLDKFKTLNITTEPELQKWSNMNETVANLSTLFQRLSGKYQGLYKLIDSIEDRNLTIDEMKKKFSDINITLNSVENDLKNMNNKLQDVENEISNTDNALNGLQTSMDNFKVLQTEAAKTKQKINSMQTTANNLENRTKSITNTADDMQSQLETMKTTYAVLNNTDWNKLLPKLEKELANNVRNLKDVNSSRVKQEEKLNSTTETVDTISSEISSKNLTRQDVNSSVSALRKRLNFATQHLNDLEKPLQANDKTLAALKKATDGTQKKIGNMNETLHNELLKYNYVKQHLPSLKEKHTTVNASFVENIPNMENNKDQIANLVSVIERIKEKMRHYGVPDTDNSLKKWDVAIEKLNATITAVLKKNKEAGEKLVELKGVLWSNDTMYTSQESLSNVITRFDSYNKTLDDINAASHTINVKLADLNSAASSVIGQLMERDAVLTTTPATTTPSGPPEWLSFHSTVSGVKGKDSAFAECSAEDLTEWHMMKITRVNKDGKEEAIGAWKLGAGARKAVRDRRIRVRKTTTATGGKLTVGIQTLQCEDEGTYYCSIDSYDMWPLESSIGVVSPPEDNIKPDFPTEVFEDKVANFSCTGHPGYPNGRMTWKIKREKEVEFRPFDFYSSKSMVSDTSCVRTENNRVEYQFDLQWNNTKVRCYIENTDFYAEGIIQLLPYDICNRVRYLGTISHPYTPHKYIVCGKELNIMQCPGNTCYDEKSENCVRCKAGRAGGGDPCHGQPLFSYVAHETDCKKYYICMGPTKTTKKCAKGYFAPKIPGNCVMSYAQSHCGRKAG